MVRLLKIAAEALVRDLGGVIFPNSKLGKIAPPKSLTITQLLYCVIKKASQGMLTELK